jgi:hypothetical protein
MGKRAKIIGEIERQIGRLDERPGLCLYYAHPTIATLRKHGYQAVIQAGSLQWPRIRPEDDDGVMNTHFAYEWSPHEPASAMSVALGNLPEMHVWVGLIDSQEITDDKIAAAILVVADVLARNVGPPACRLPL